MFFIKSIISYPTMHIFIHFFHIFRHIKFLVKILKICFSTGKLDIFYTLLSQNRFCLGHSYIFRNKSTNSLNCLLVWCKFKSSFILTTFIMISIDVTTTDNISLIQDKPKLIRYLIQIANSESEFVYFILISRWSDSSSWCTSRWQWLQTYQWRRNRFFM